ncbi:MAG: hypothetical protein M1282_13590 [Chloroflexi bacterium]|nr:hypothetical protein [Chloroflexota bacterium]
MLNNLESRWPFLSILLLLILLAGSIFSPALTGILARLVLMLGPGMAIAFIICRQAQAYRAGKIDTAAMVRHIFFEVLGLLLAMALAILLSQVAAGLAVPLLGSGLVSTVILMIAVVLLGLGAAWLVKVTWGRLITK